MKHFPFFATVLLLCLPLMGQSQPVGNKITTPWASQVNPEDVLPEYPRPQLVRGEWMTLNGKWDYAIAPVGGTEPQNFQGKILVPFAVESALSGVGQRVGEANELWYHRTFTVPAAWRNKNVLLHFGAVDWYAAVFVNDVMVGEHKGGYTPFSFDVTPYLTGKGPQKLTVRVWDPSNKGFQPRGKQVEKPSGIWYTPVTGIWQTVWMEPVAASYIAAIKAVPDVDKGIMKVTVSATNAAMNQPMPTTATVQLLQDGKVVAQAKGIPGAELRLAVANPHLWSPDDPFLYDMKVTLSSGITTLDNVTSYTAFRKISVARDAQGVARMQLNNTFLFQMGPLDQGWWPDGLYTAPTDQALQFDIEKTKELGFNMIRKHVKVEPARWYYHCDRLGILVWQDMPSGDLGNSWAPGQYNGGNDKARSAESEANYYREWKEIMDLTVSNPCVVVWVPFNEGWGQFKTEEVVAWTKAYDPSRLVNPASGGNHRACGDILDLHNYPNPSMYLFDPQRVNVLGEYGGIGLALEGHLWEPERNWGYVQYKSSQEVTDEYVKFANQLIEFVHKGYAAAVYTQTTDCEIEINGLMTYDRKVVKVDAARVRAINQAVIKAGTPE